LVTLHETDYNPDHQRKTLEALARGIFYFGALASMLDGVLTWLVVRRVGTSIERNSAMGWFMEHLGLMPTLILRVLLGVVCFWYVANLLVGRRMFVRSSRAAKYARWVSKTDRPRYQETFMRARPYLTALETIFILAVTCVVVGNNINAYVVFIHSSH
jgi:hypothetical protein